MGCKKLEMRILNAHIPHPVSHFKIQGISRKMIELGPEKWEMRTKSEFSSLKVRPLVCQSFGGITGVLFSPILGRMAAWAA